MYICITFISIYLFLPGYIMSSRASKPKPIEVSEPTDEWIWGNNRGGGGAPLKDVGGTPVANLRSVMKGNAQVDYSPTRSPIKNTPTRRRAAHSPDVEEEDRDRRPRRRNHSQDRDRDRSPDRDRDNRDNRDRRGHSPPPDLVRGLEGHYGGGEQGGQGGHRPPNGIRDMHGNDPAKEQKAKRDLEYQAQLQAQIDEKKHLKEKEKRKDDAIKRVELDEFMSQQKGSFRNKNKVIEQNFDHGSSPDKSRGGKGKRVSYGEDQDSVGSERDRDRDRGGNQQPHGGGARRRKDRGDSGSEDGYSGGGRQARGGQAGKQRSPRRGHGSASRYEDDCLSDDQDERSDGQSPPRNDRDRAKPNDRAAPRAQRPSGGRAESRDEYVTQGAYDELAGMYADMKAEHAALREELFIQNDLIKVCRCRCRCICATYHCLILITIMDYGLLIMDYDVLILINLC
jgi:hypothetical protein